MKCNTSVIQGRNTVLRTNTCNYITKTVHIATSCVIRAMDTPHCGVFHYIHERRNNYCDLYYRTESEIGQGIHQWIHIRVGQ